MEIVREVPQLKTERLVLRPFALTDAAHVEQLAGDREVASTTLHIPHPYPAGSAQDWIATHAEAAATGRGYTFAITDKATGELMGTMGISVWAAHCRAELGYWIGRPYWGKGYATEAARRVVEFGFEALGLNRIDARHFTRNPASGRVMQKCGMTYEGTERQAILKWGQFEDLACYSILRDEYL